MTELIPRVRVLGIDVSAIDVPGALDIMDEWVRDREPHYVCVTGVHGVMESQRDAGLRQIHQDAGLVTADGMPLVWLGRLRGHPQAERVYGPDLMLSCCAWSVDKGYRHFFYGGNEGVAERLAERLAQSFPGLQVAGTFTPPFRALTSAEDDAVIRQINASRADFVWVGLGTPKQERWMHEHRAQLTAPVLLGVGAAFDFHAGVKKQAPRWMQRNGLEWLFRLAAEPTRLWRRYLVIIPAFSWNLALEAAGLRHFGTPPDLQASGCNLTRASRARETGTS